MIFIILGLILGFLYGLQEEGFSFGVLVALGGFLAGSFICFIKKKQKNYYNNLYYCNDNGKVYRKSDDNIASGCA